MLISLPHELLEFIVKHLSLSDVKNVSATCTRMYEATQNLIWNKPRSKLLSPQVLKMFQHLPIQVLHTEDLETDFLSKYINILAKMSSLKTIIVDGKKSSSHLTKRPFAPANLRPFLKLKGVDIIIHIGAVRIANQKELETFINVLHSIPPTKLIIEGFGTQLNRDAHYWTVHELRLLLPFPVKMIRLESLKLFMRKLDFINLLKQFKSSDISVGIFLSNDLVEEDDGWIHGIYNFTPEDLEKLVQIGAKVTHVSSGCLRPPRYTIKDYTDVLRKMPHLRTCDLIENDDGNMKIFQRLHIIST